jgi:hypothetical protein
MRTFARIENGFVAQLIQLPAELEPGDVYVASTTASFVDVTKHDAPPRIGWLHLANGGFAPPASLLPGLAPDEAKRRARDLLYASDAVIEHFYEHLLPVPETWAAYRFALRRIMFLGRLPTGDRLEQPEIPVFSFKRDAVHAARELPADVLLPSETRRFLARGRAVNEAVGANQGAV